jgi:hypothetical protein
MMFIMLLTYSLLYVEALPPGLPALIQAKLNHHGIVVVLPLLVIPMLPHHAPVSVNYVTESESHGPHHLGIGLAASRLGYPLLLEFLGLFDDLGGHQEILGGIDTLESDLLLLRLGISAR